MDGMIKLLNFIIDNWSLLVAFVIVVYASFIQLKKFFAKSDEEKLLIAKKMIKETVLKLCDDAEASYSDWVKAGEIKRAQVIGEIYKQYPVLSTVANQEDIIDYIDSCIEDALVKLRKVIEENEDSFVITTKEEN